MTSTTLNINHKSNWYIAKTKGNRVRYRNIRTGAWSGWKPKPVGLPRPQRPATQVPESPVQLASVPVASVTADSGMGEETSLDEMTRDELRALARANGLRGYSRMTKAELSAALIHQN